MNQVLDLNFVFVLELGIKEVKDYLIKYLKQLYW